MLNPIQKLKVAILRLNGVWNRWAKTFDKVGYETTFWWWIPASQHQLKHIRGKPWCALSELSLKAIEKKLSKDVMMKVVMCLTQHWDVWKLKWVWQLIQTLGSESISSSPIFRHFYQVSFLSWGKFWSHLSYVIFKRELTASVCFTSLQQKRVYTSLGSSCPTCVHQSW